MDQPKNDTKRQDRRQDKDEGRNTTETTTIRNTSMSSWWAKDDARDKKGHKNEPPGTKKTRDYK